ncbi:hypothetical protein ACMUEG_19185, partial [Vibrio cholerae]|uniref:hypothetical protein n=1 Tax=Vibrio cholerae TaxID=666 RepID=UPI0039C93C55
MPTAPILIHQPRRLAVGAGTVAQVGDWAGKTASTLVIATPLTAKLIGKALVEPGNRLQIDRGIFANGR